LPTRSVPIVDFKVSQYDGKSQLIEYCHGSISVEVTLFEFSVSKDMKRKRKTLKYRGFWQMRDQWARMWGATPKIASSVKSTLHKKGGGTKGGSGIFMFY